MARFSQDYPEDAENPVRYFEIYSPPIRTQYSQVWWTMMQDVPIPADVVEGGRLLARR